jgi:hypothetical protein
MKKLAIRRVLRDMDGTPFKRQHGIHLHPINRRIRYMRVVGQHGVPFRGVERNKVYWATREKRTARIMAKYGIRHFTNVPS